MWHSVPIGLDPDAALREFLALYPDPVETLEPAPPPSGVTVGEGGPPTRIREIMGTAIGSLSRLRRTHDEPAAPLPVIVVSEPVPPVVSYLS